ncbi:MAG: DNA-directed RNA polymerase subunit H [Thermoplasmata archaeon]|nr:DNA-directed RNA polymerase subunit H [Thermoplasmata archaeon]
MGKKIDVLKHELVPEHIILSDKDAKEVLKKYNVSIDQLPRIFDTDPVVRAIGAKPGQIIKIIRRSPTAKKSIAYRVVIESAKSILNENLGEE